MLVLIRCSVFHHKGFFMTENIDSFTCLLHVVEQCKKGASEALIKSFYHAGERTIDTKTKIFSI